MSLGQTDLTFIAHKILICCRLTVLQTHTATTTSFPPFQRVEASSLTDMDQENMSHTLAKPYLPLFNGTVNTTYRFIFYQVSYSVIFLAGLVTNTLALRRLSTISQQPEKHCHLHSQSICSRHVFCSFFTTENLLLPSKGRLLSSEPLDTGSGLLSAQLHSQIHQSVREYLLPAVHRGGSYLAVVHTLRSSVRWRQVAQLLTSLIWGLVLGLSLGLLLLRSTATHQHEPCLLDPSSPQHRTVILVAPGVVQGTFVLPTGLLLFCYCRVLSVQRKPRHHSHRRQNTLTIIYWVLAVFLSCFVPYHINLLGYTLTHVGLLPNCTLAKITKALHPLELSVASSNCCLNPLIYYFSRRLVQTAFVWGQWQPVILIDY